MPFVSMRFRKAYPLLDRDPRFIFISVILRSQNRPVKFLSGVWIVADRHTDRILNNTVQQT